MVREIVGHADIGVTLQIYAHPVATAAPSPGGGRALGGKRGTGLGFGMRVLEPWFLHVQEVQHLASLRRADFGSIGRARASD